MRYFCFQAVGIFQSTNQSINPSIHPSINQTINHTINLSSINILASLTPQITSSVGGTVASWLVQDLHRAGKKIEYIIPNFKQLPSLQLIGELMTSSNQYINIQLAKFI